MAWAFLPYFKGCIFKAPNTAGINGKACRSACLGEPACVESIMNIRERFDKLVFARVRPHHLRLGRRAACTR